jgi:hypothetical protein
METLNGVTAMITIESAIEYVNKTFAESFDNILSCTIDSDGVAVVTVKSGDWIGTADVWYEPGFGIYGEL